MNTPPFRTNDNDDSLVQTVETTRLHQQQHHPNDDDMQESVHVKFSPFVKILGEKTDEELYGDEEGSMRLDGLLGSSQSSNESRGAAGWLASISSSRRNNNNNNSDGSFARYNHQRQQKPTQKPNTNETSLPQFDPYQRNDNNIESSFRMESSSGSIVSHGNSTGGSRMLNRNGALFGGSNSSNNSNNINNMDDSFQNGAMKQLSLTEKGFSSFGEIDSDWDAATSSSAAESGASSPLPPPPAVAPMEQSFSVFSLLGASMSTTATASTTATPPPPPRHPRANPPAAAPASPVVVTDSYTAVPLNNDATYHETEKETFRDEHATNYPEEGKGDGNNNNYEDDDDKTDPDEESVLSTSEHDEGASSIDAAEQNERHVRKTLFFAVLSALGIVAVSQLLSRWIAKCFNGSGEELAVDAAADAAGDVVTGTAMVPPAGSEQAMGLAANAAMGQTTQYVFYV